MRLRPTWVSLLIAAWAVLLGDQGFSALRLAAWSGMLVSYSRDAGLSAGLKQTFDGAHPCPMCRVLNAVQNSDQDRAELSPSRVGAGAAERVPAANRVAPVATPPGPTWRLSANDPQPESLTRKPALPPPRT